MYDNTPNQGMRCIQDIVRRFGEIDEWRVFDVRGKAEVPDQSYDIFISTGGPGSPHDGDGIWDAQYYDWLRSTWEHNLRARTHRKKHVFFICHSFQMACKFFRVGQVVRRRSTSFGTFQCHPTSDGRKDALFDGLPDPFYVADFRDWQVIHPDELRLRTMGASILALEKSRPHVALPRALMAVRFSPEFFGTQFHPEADPEGMLDHFLDPQRRREIIQKHSQEKYLRMIEHLEDPDKISLTHEIVLPMFIQRAIRTLQRESVAAV